MSEATTKSSLLRRGSGPIALLGLIMALSVGVAFMAPAVRRDVQIDSSRAVTQQVCLPWPATTQPATRKIIVSNGDISLKSAAADVRFESQVNQVAAGNSLTLAKITAPTDFTVEGAAAASIVALAYTRTNTGIARGLALERCQSPAQEWWFGGLASTSGTSATLTLFNPDNEDVVAAISGYSADGLYKTAVGNRVLVKARGTRNIDLTQLFPAISSLAVRVAVTEGRVSATVNAAQVQGVNPLGRTVVAGVTSLAPTAVIAGVPAQAAGTRLQLLSPTEDAVVAVQVSTKSGLVTLAGAERLSLQAGKVQTIDLPGDLWDSTASVIVQSSANIVASVRQLRQTADAEDLNIQSQQSSITTRGITISPDKLVDEQLFAFAADDADVSVSAYRAGKLLWTVTSKVAAGTTQQLSMMSPLTDGGLLTVSATSPIQLTHWVYVGKAREATSSSVSVVEQTADLVAGASLDLTIS